MAMDHPEPVIYGLQHRSDGVRGAGRRRHDPVSISDGVVVDAMDNVLQRTVARSGQQYPCNTRALQVLGEPCGITPTAGVVHHQGVRDAVGGVVNGGRVVRVDDLHLHPVGRDGVGILVDSNGAVKGTVNGVTAQQAGTLGKVVVRPAAHHNGPQAQSMTATDLSNQQASQEPADPTEAVEHDVGAGTVLATVLADDPGKLGTKELLQGGTVAIFCELLVQAGNVDHGRTELQLRQSVQ